MPQLLVVHPGVYVVPKSMETFLTEFGKKERSCDQAVNVSFINIWGCAQWRKTVLETAYYFLRSNYESSSA